MGAPDETEAREQRQRGEGGVFAAVQSEDETLALPIFRDESKAGGKGLFDGAEGKRAVVDADFTGSRGIETEERLHDLAATGANNAGQTDDFAGAD